jgi:hypothetical protein
MVQWARTDRSIRDNSLEESPIIMRRLVDDTCWMTNGGFETSGRAGTIVRRSWTTCLARIGSVPGSKIISTDDNPGIESERILSSHGIPLKNSCSIGLVMRFSTSSAESPSASV